VSRTPGEDAERLARELQALAGRLAAAEVNGARIFTREDLERLIGQRMGREKRRQRELERDLDEAERERDELAAALQERGPGRLLHPTPVVPPRNHHGHPSHTLSDKRGLAVRCGGPGSNV
jgi:hypothetical protein